MSSFFDWFEMGENQRQEAEFLIQQILLKNMLLKAAQLKDKKFVIDGFKLSTQNKPEAKEFVVTAATIIEVGYYDLIQEFLSKLTLKELTDLQQSIKQ